MLCEIQYVALMSWLALIQLNLPCDFACQLTRITAALVYHLTLAPSLLRTFDICLKASKPS